MKSCLYYLIQGSKIRASKARIITILFKIPFVSGVVSAILQFRQKCFLKASGDRSKIMSRSKGVRRFHPNVTIRDPGGVSFLNSMRSSRFWDNQNFAG